MAINIKKMEKDGVQSHLIFLAEMEASSQFEKIAMGLKNPQLFSQFLGLDESAVVWDYAYAAGLISRADADLMKSYEGGETMENNGSGEIPDSPPDSGMGEINPGEGAGEIPGE